MSAGMLTVLAKPHALKQELVKAQFPVGQTLDRIIGPDSDGLLRATISGVDVPRKLWPHLKPRAGSTVYVRMGMQGGNGGKLLRTIALIAVAYLSMGVAIGGRLLVAEITRDAVNVRTVADLEAGA
jgi:hypothetical protein